MAAILLLAAAIVMITQCDGSTFCTIMSAVGIFGAVIGLLGAAFINPVFLAVFMFLVFLAIIGQIVLLVITFLGDWTTLEVAFEFVTLGFLIITLGFASDLRHVLIGGAAPAYAPQSAPQTTIINSNPMPQPQTTTTIVQ